MSGLFPLQERVEWVPGADRDVWTVLCMTSSRGTRTWAGSRSKSEVEAGTGACTAFDDLVSSPTRQFSQPDAIGRL